MKASKPVLLSIMMVAVMEIVKVEMKIEMMDTEEAGDLEVVGEMTAQIFGHIKLL